MGMFSSPKQPTPPPPTAPLQEIDAKSREAGSMEQQQLALMRGINSTWSSQSMMGKSNNQGLGKQTTLG